MERLSAEGHFFHRECFKCEICSTTLHLGIYAFDVEEGNGGAIYEYFEMSEYWCF